MSRNVEEEAVLVRNLAEKVKEKCGSEDIIVSLELCLFLVDLKVLQLLKTLAAVAADEKLMNTIIKYCVEDLKENGISIETLKLQIFWRKKYRDRDEIQKIHHETIFKNILPLLTEISEGSLITTVDKEELYKQIVIFIIMFAGLGNPTQPLIVKETQVALCSIFKTTEIDNFLNLPKSIKEQQLIEFARLVTGIKLFNKDCKKGGEGIDDLPLILTQGVQATKERLSNFKNQLDKRINQIVSGLSKFYGSKCSESDIEDELPTACSGEEEEENVKRLLFYFRQIESYIKNLLKDLEDSQKIIDKLVKRLQTNLLQVHEVVRYRVAISTVQVFPLFLQLSNIWVEMQEEVDILSEINNIFLDFSLIAKLPERTSSELLLSSISESPTFSDGSEINDDSFEFFPGVKILSFSSISGREDLQYQGFCAWTVANNQGLLITGNPKIGVMYYRNRFYCFSSAEVACKWAKNPKKYIKTTMSVARAKPELICLLNLYNDLESTIREEDTAPEGKVKRENAEVQTELHPIDTYINRDYTFSEWELKRRVLKLASLTRLLTKSQQTMEDRTFYNDVGIQVTPNKSKSTQTRKSTACNHSKFPKFFLGLKAEHEEFSALE